MSWLALRPLIVHRQHALTRLKVWQEANISYGRGPTHWILSHNGHAPRTLSTTAIYTVLTPPAVFAGLVFSLWFYKCCIMILFQNKIIYMPSIPPFSRSEKLADYARPCLPVVWREEKLKTADGVELSLCIASTGSHGSTRPHERHVIILYFQG